MYKAYSVGLEQKDFELIRKIGAFLTTETISIKDLTYHNIKTEDDINNVVLIFGDKASQRLKGITTKTTLFLPEIRLLHAETGSEQKRVETFKKLKELKDKEDLKKPKMLTEVITDDPVITLSVTDLKALETNLRSRNVNSWIGKTESGKIIQISIVPEDGSANIRITFSELYALKTAMEVLDIKEFTIVYANSNTKNLIKGTPS
jgi:hypothetical protein